MLIVSKNMVRINILKKFRYLVIAVQVLAVMFFIGFGIYLSVNSNNVSPVMNSKFLENIDNLVKKVISLEKSQGILWIFLNNFKVNAVQTILSFLTLGFLGIFTLAKDCVIYGFAFEHCKNIFVLFELITSVASVVISTYLSFDMYFKKRKVWDCIYYLSTLIILSCIPLLIGAIIEGNLVYK